MTKELDELLIDMSDSIKKELNVMVPAMIDSYDKDSNRAVVSIQRELVGRDGVLLQLKPITGVPVIQVGGGGFVVFSPLKQGDLGWLLFADFNLGSFLNQYKASPAQDSRTHDFADGVFLPDVMKGFSGGSGLSIQKSDGSSKIEILEDGSVSIISNNSLTVDCPTTTFNSAVVMNQGFSVPPGQQGTVGGVSIGGHVHTEHDNFTTGGMRN